MNKLSGEVGRTFTNWSTTFSCKPEFYFEPTSKEEIIQILEEARRLSKRVKVCGYGHSPSDIACTDGYMIDLCRLNQLIEVDEEKCTVKVESGCLLRDLIDDVLEPHDMSIRNMGSVSEITIGGAISTGTHGTGANYGIFATQVLEIDIITAAGDQLTCSKSENSELFSAVCCNLGCLGVVTAVKLQCEPKFRLCEKRWSCTLDEVLDNLNDYVNSSEHFRFMWVPRTEAVIMYTADRTKLPIQDKSSWFWDMFVGYHCMQFAYWLREQTPTVLRELKAWLDSNPDVPAHLPVEVRFAKGDDIMISPANGRDTCFTNIIAYRPYGKDIPHAKYWSAYETIVKRVGGRPHWAKAHKETGQDFAKMYPAFERFCEIRKKLDPQGMFLNRYLEQVFSMETGASGDS